MSYSNFEHVKVSAMIGVVPQKCIDVDDEIQYYKNDDKILERNKKILGLSKRYVVDEKTVTSDLVEDAAIKLINKYNIDKDKIESLVVVSTSHDYSGPATACILHGRLNLNKECSCYDLSGLGCTGYVYSLLTVFSMIESGAVKNCLLLCGDIPSRHSDTKNRKVNMLFGDAGTATFIEYSEEKNPSYFYTGTFGEGWNKIVTPASGWALPVRSDIADLEIVNEDNDVWHLWDDIILGMDVFKFSMEIGPKSISNILEYSNKTMEDIDFFAIHQANKQIVDTVATHSRLPKEKYSTETFSKYANCSTASVVTVLLDQCKDKNTVLLCTFGVGLSFADAIIDYSKTKNYGMQTFEPVGKQLTRKEKIEYWIKFYKG